MADGLESDDIARRAFEVTRRGYEQQEVRGFLHEVSALVERLQRDVLELRVRAERAEAKAAQAGEPDEALLMERLGAETTRVLTSAREAAAEIRTKAEADAERIVTNATLDAAEARAAAMRGADRRVAEAEAERESLLEEARTIVARRQAEAEEAARAIHEAVAAETNGLREELAQSRARTSQEAEAALEDARTQGRGMVAEAQEVRERVLADLAARRKRARRQIEQLNAGRERLLQAYDVVRRLLDESTQELGASLADARLAADAAAQRVEDEPEATIEDLTREADGLAGLPAARAVEIDDGSGSGLGVDVEPEPESEIEPESEPAEPAQPAAGAGVPSSAAQPAALSEVPPGVDQRGRRSRRRGRFVDRPDVHPSSTDSPVAAEPWESGSEEWELESVRLVVPEPSVDPAPVDDHGHDDVGDGLPVAPSELPPRPPPPAEPPTPEPVVADASGSLPAPFPDPDPEPEPAPQPERPEPQPVPEREPQPQREPAAASPTTDDGNGAASVDDLFARLRAARVPAEAAPEPGHPTELDAEGEGLVSVFTEREMALEPLVRELGRGLKRALADEQNEVLDRLRRSQPRSADELLLDADAHAARWAGVAESILAEAASAGASWTGGRPGPVADLADELARSLTAPLRDRVDRCFAASDGNLDEVADRVRALYREWKGQRLAEASGHFASAAFARGVYDAMESQAPVHWVVDPSGTPCPDCDDNVLGGTIPRGTEFPTGHECAPAHPGCRCLVLASGG